MFYEPFDCLKSPVSLFTAFKHTSGLISFSHKSTNLMHVQPYYTVWFDLVCTQPSFTTGILICFPGSCIIGYERLFCIMSDIELIQINKFWWYSWVIFREKMFIYMVTCYWLTLCITIDGWMWYTCIVLSWYDTALCIFKLNVFPVPVRLLSGSIKLIFRRYFIIFCDI